MLARLWSFFNRFSLPSVAEVERDYLNASVSRFDFERRERQIEQGLFRRGSFDA